MTALRRSDINAGMEKYSPDKHSLVMTREQVRAFDFWAINELGMAGIVLMENAGRSCAGLIEDKLAGIKSPRVYIFCGTGNNGGDGYVIARHLLNSGYKVTVVIIGDRNKVIGDAKINLELLERIGQPFEQLNPETSVLASRVKTLTEGSHMIVDAVFGTGLKGQLKKEFVQLFEIINAQNCPILAVDIPSGLDCDTGKPLGGAVKADYTVTFVAAKTGFAKADAAQYTGEIFVTSIGVVPA